MKKLIIEVGSTVTKVDTYDGNSLKRIKDITIEFKNNYKKNNKLLENDIETLIQHVNSLKEETYNIYICGTSIFRNLNDQEKNNFLTYFKNKTGLDFHIISQEKEQELTVYGATRNITDKVCIMIGGGGSTEITLYDKKIIESVNYNIGVIDVMQKFPDLADDLATTDLEEVKAYIKSNLSLPKNKSDILILAGGNHEYFAINSGISYEKNTLYEDQNQPIMMDIETRKRDTNKYFKEIHLDEIRSRVDDPNWWFATRAMCAFVLVIAESIEAKYIVPTNIAMAYGLLKEK